MKQHLAIVSFLVSCMFCAGSGSVHEYECRQGKCTKVELVRDAAVAVSLPECRMLCGSDLGTLWPKPRGSVQHGQSLLSLDRDRIEFELPNDAGQQRLWQENKARFLKMLDNKVLTGDAVSKGDHALTIHISVAAAADASVGAEDDAVPKLTLDTDESYSLNISAVDGAVVAHIDAKTFFGARHGLETLSQLIVYNDVSREMKILAEAAISDAPAYRWRGLLLDTARQFYRIDAIKRIIDAMAMSKLNTFHWHITDSQSFPLEVRSQPDLYRFGAYGRHKIYTHADIVEVREHGRSRGVRVMPEFDAPAHVGAGWHRTNMTACFNAQPWHTYCAEPPCGQLDPTVDALYPVLEDIYREMFELFEPDVFHMGGDEVSVACWNSSERIRNWTRAHGGDSSTKEPFMRLWNAFQQKALERVDNVSGGREVPIILWTSTLTQLPYLTDYLDKERYIIQSWQRSTDENINDLLNNGYRVIVSNADALYLDCGQSGWVTRTYWCRRYTSWRDIYSNGPRRGVADVNAGRVLGAEAAIWSEQIDEMSLESRTWPRASAMAERLWTEADAGWQAAEHRMYAHRERLVENGIRAEPLQPEWCQQNEGACTFQYNENTDTTTV